MEKRKEGSKKKENKNKEYKDIFIYVGSQEDLIFFSGGFWDDFRWLVDNCFLFTYYVFILMIIG